MSVFVSFRSRHYSSFHQDNRSLRSINGSRTNADTGSLHSGARVDGTTGDAVFISDSKVDEAPSRNSGDTVGVRPNAIIVPIMQQRDLIEREMRWLIPLGVGYLQALWEDEDTDSRIIDAVMDYAMKTSGNGESRGESESESKGQQQQEEEEHSTTQYQSNTHFYSSPYELLMTLDVARR